MHVSRKVTTITARDEVMGMKYSQARIRTQTNDMGTGKARKTLMPHFVSSSGIALRARYPPLWWQLRLAFFSESQPGGQRRRQLQIEACHYCPAPSPGTEPERTRTCSSSGQARRPSESASFYVSLNLPTSGLYAPLLAVVARSPGLQGQA